MTVRSQTTMACSACRLVKPEADFQPSYFKRGQGRCRLCQKEYRAAWKAANPEKVRESWRRYAQENPDKVRATRQRYEAKNKSKIRVSKRKHEAQTGAASARRLKSRYGISREEYDLLLSIQGGGCAVCGALKCSDGRKLVVDHCHATGAVRGILCHKCNAGIGMLGDSPDRLRAALDYLFRQAVSGRPGLATVAGLSAGLVH